MRATRAVIHLENLKNNIRLIRSMLSPGVSICLAVKADAYGHGAEGVAAAAMEEGITSFGIATVEEGAELRRAGIRARLILFSLALPEEIPEIVEHGLSVFASDRDFLGRLSREAERRKRRVGVHLKVDTGMGRVGCRPDEAAGLACFISGSPGGLSLEGLCTHLAAADSLDRAHTETQLREFRRAETAVRAARVNPGILHAANSAGVFHYPEAHLDMVRPGIAAYGYPPVLDGSSAPAAAPAAAFRPVMELQSLFIFIKEVPAGSTISYGMTHRTARRTFIGTVPAGYADGYNRLLSNRGRVLAGGRTYPVVGRICMDQFMVDLGPEPVVSLYDRVTLFGPDPAGPDAAEIAAITGTIPYEVTCAVSRRVERVFMSSGADR